MILPSVIPTSFAPDDPLLVRLIASGLFGGTSAYDPLSLNPYLWLRGGVDVLKTGGDPADLLGPVAAWGDQSPNGNDAGQTDGIVQPVNMRDGSSFFYSPGTTGNYLSLPLPAGDYDLEIEYHGESPFTDVVSSDGTMTLGPTGSEWNHKAVSRITLSQSSDIIADVDFTTLTKDQHGVTSFNAVTGQPVTVHQSGGNPARVVTIPSVNPYAGAYMTTAPGAGTQSFTRIAVLTVYNEGVFFTNATTYDNPDPGASYLFCYSDGSIESSQNGDGGTALMTTRRSGVGHLGSLICVITTHDGTNAGHRLRVNEVDATDSAYTGDPGTYTKAATPYGIGAYNDGSQSCDCDLLLVGEYPFTMTEEQLLQLEAWALNEFAITP